MRVGEVILRSVPRVAPLQPLYGSAAIGILAVAATANPGTAMGRLRPAYALVAASLAFALDDDAAITLGSAPITLAVRRGARVFVACWIALTWFAFVVLAADLRSAAALPPSAALVEAATVAAIAIGASCLAIGRSDDGRGGAFGAVVAMVCFGTAYLPPKSWWPFTARPEVGRLLVIMAVAAAVGVVASIDPARRRPRFLREDATSKFGGTQHDDGARSRA